VTALATRLADDLETRAALPVRPGGARWSRCPAICSLRRPWTSPWSWSTTRVTAGSAQAAGPEPAGPSQWLYWCA